MGNERYNKRLLLRRMTGNDTIEKTELDFPPIKEIKIKASHPRKSKDKPGNDPLESPYPVGFFWGKVRE